MNNSIQDKLALFTNNYQIIKNNFGLNNTLTKQMAAFLYAQADKTIDYEAISQCLMLIKQNTGLFSFFRGHMTLCIATLLSLSSNPQDLLSKTLKVYDLLKSKKFRASLYLVITAYQIVSQSKPSEYETVVTRTRAFYDGIKANHFFYTGQDDNPFVAMLGQSDLDVVSGVARVDKIYSQLKNNFRAKNSVQSLAQVLALSSENNMEHRVLALSDALRTQKTKLDKTYTLPLLGILALLPTEIDVIVRAIDETQSILRTKKGFGMFSINKQGLLLFVAALVADEYAPESKDDVLTTTLSTSIMNIIIAQHNAIIIANSSSSSSS